MQLTIEVPVRACDVGGWTDTWFAGHGRVCSLAVEPGVTVTVRAEPGDGQVTFDLVDYGIGFALGDAPPEHGLLVAAAREAAGPRGMDVELRIESAVPPGSSLGSSASVCVGVVAALDAIGGAVRSPAALAQAAHRAEAGGEGRESGVQDHVAASHGGACDVEVPAYPEVTHRAIALAPSATSALDRRLLHVAYGTPHDSSAVHQEVIAALEAEGHAAGRLESLRVLAAQAVDALEAGDLDRYGAVLTSATDSQSALHPALLSSDAHELIELARTHEATGWKLNGAGGGGGSISILCAGGDDRDALRDAASRLGHRPLDLVLASSGARVA